jgi:hypothetical protein
VSSILEYGPPGGGKTTLAASMSKLGYVPWFYDMDRKIHGMSNLKSMVKSGEIRVTIPEEALSEMSLRQKLTLGTKGKALKQPKGYLEMVDWVTALEEDPPEDHDNVVPVLDSLTRALEHLKRFTLFSSGKSSMEFSEWAFVLANLEELFDSFFRLTPDIYPHCIIIAHDTLEKDEVIGKARILPLIDGQMRGKAGSYVSEMYYVTAEASKDGKVAYQVQTKPIGLIHQARSSRDLEVWEEADFAILFQDEKHVNNGADKKEGGGKKK